ncbi:MAG: hypothetical protein ACLFP1_01145 [Candidatus Goldiibacteriota bacterium]
MNTFKTAVILLIISNNLFIFFYGIYSHIDASCYLQKVREQILFDSFKAAAYQNFEDSSIKTEKKSGSFKIDGAAGRYFFEKISDDKLYMKIDIKNRRETASRKYIFPLK